MKIDLKNIESADNNRPPKGNSVNSDVPFWKREISLKKSFPNKRKADMYAEFAIMIENGVDILTSVDLLYKEEKKAQEKQFFLNAKDRLVMGDSFSAIVKDKFSSYEYYSIKMGEESGRLAEVFGILAEFYDRKVKQSRQLISAITYPIVVLLTAVLAVWFMLSFIVPLFSDVFTRFGSELPALTEMLMEMSEFMNQYSSVIFFVILGVVLTLYRLRKRTFMRRLSGNLVMRIPFLRNLFTRIYVDRLFQALSLLVKANVPLVRAIELSGKMIGFYPLERIMERIHKGLMVGENLYVLMEREKFFDSKLTVLIKVGEEVNQLGNMFDKLHKQLSEEVEHKASQMGSIVEPMLIIIVGGLVGTILIAMYLPMFQLGGSIMGQ